jgi:zinc transport system ATP-binding protein
MAYVTCDNVSLGYGNKTAISGLNFTVSAGNYLCIVGENGAGKTTLIRALLKLKSVSSGAIITGDGLLPHDIGYLPQQTSVQRNFPASVNEIVLSGRLNTAPFKPFYTNSDRRDADEKMKRLGILNLKNCSYRELSGGQQQRVLLARALCASRKMILLDEPVSGLDPEATSELYRFVRELNKNDGMTVIMVSHDIAGALVDATHVLHLASRKQLFFGTVDEYRKCDVGRFYTGDKICSC